MFICPASNGLVLKSAWAFVKRGRLWWSSGGEFLNKGFLGPILISIG